MLPSAAAKYATAPSDGGGDVEPSNTAGRATNASASPLGASGMDASSPLLSAGPTRRRRHLAPLRGGGGGGLGAGAGALPAVGGRLPSLDGMRQHHTPGAAPGAASTQQNSLPAPAASGRTTTAMAAGTSAFPAAGAGRDPEGGMNVAPVAGVGPAAATGGATLAETATGPHAPADRRVADTPAAAPGPAPRPSGAPAGSGASAPRRSVSSGRVAPLAAAPAPGGSHTGAASTPATAADLRPRAGWAASSGRGGAVPNPTAAGARPGAGDAPRAKRASSASSGGVDGPSRGGIGLATADEAKQLPMAASTLSVYQSVMSGLDDPTTMEDAHSSSKDLHGRHGVPSARAEAHVAGNVLGKIRKSNTSYRAVTAKVVRRDEDEYQRSFAETVMQQEKRRMLLQGTGWKKGWLILPSSPRLEYWSMYTLLLVVYTAIMVPIDVGFDLQRGTFWDIFDLIVDLSFFVDIMVHFRTAVFDSDTGQLVTDTTRIRRKYLRSWFLCDLLSAIPFGAAWWLVLKDLELHPRVRYVKALQGLKILRIGRFIKPFDHNRFASLVKLVKLLAFYALCVHWFGCAWHFIGIVEVNRDPTQVWFNDWMEPRFTFADRYVASTHMAMAQLVGNSMDPRNFIEQAFGTFMMLFGACINAALFGQVAVLFENRSSLHNRHKQMLDNMNRSMRVLSLPPDVQKRVRNYAEFQFQRHRALNYNSFLRRLSEPLATEVCLFMHRDTVTKVPLFQYCSAEFLAALVQSLEHRLFMPGDYIIRFGAFGDDMYFVNSGECDVIAPDGKTTLATLSTGEYFGELALLTRARRTATVQATSYCDTSSFSRFELDRLLDMYPDVAPTMREIAKKRVAAFMRATAAMERARRLARKVKSQGMRGLMSRLGKSKASPAAEVAASAGPGTIAVPAGTASAASVPGTVSGEGSGPNAGGEAAAAGAGGSHHQQPDEAYHHNITLFGTSVAVNTAKRSMRRWHDSHSRLPSVAEGGAGEMRGNLQFPPPPPTSPPPAPLPGTGTSTGAGTGAGTGAPRVTASAGMSGASTAPAGSIVAGGSARSLDADATDARPVSLQELSDDLAAAGAAATPSSAHSADDRREPEVQLAGFLGSMEQASRDRARLKLERERVGVNPRRGAGPSSASAAAGGPSVSDSGSGSAVGSAGSASVHATGRVGAGAGRRRKRRSLLGDHDDDDVGSTSGSVASAHAGLDGAALQATLEYVADQIGHLSHRVTGIESMLRAAQRRSNGDM